MSISLNTLHFKRLQNLVYWSVQKEGYGQIKGWFRESECSGPHGGAEGARPQLHKVRAVRSCQKQPPLNRIYVDTDKISLRHYYVGAFGSIVRLNTVGRSAYNDQSLSVSFTRDDGFVLVVFCPQTYVQRVLLTSPIYSYITAHTH